jgi:hypothetical protein
MNLYDPILFKAVNVNFNYQFFFKMVTISYLGLYNVQDFAQIL